ncbi:hypothetical protein BO85DRAFT_134107 [Aspergillus piperis CBS 112811]|uniref:Uncharacterized protein n=1 Tax=Aspergillus piperis CBS 112811 TaxID=1448313 RepID=A0A8G1VR07_9EURO|nr:hypothetical protein BO85DRAFT_134107 [Aspergillus piperis CBS 112811]RAH62391.1 hypothetical protein BO85DRAFT_134107 [Aspergillus piperis CBS 112811]
MHRIDYLSTYLFPQSKVQIATNSQTSLALPLQATAYSAPLMRRIREKREGSKVLQIHKRTREGLRVNVRYQFDFFMLLNFNQYFAICCCCCWRSQVGRSWKGNLSLFD